MAHSAWLSANLRQRGAYDALCEADRAASTDRCPFCGVAGCGSALCETKRRKAEQQAKLQAAAARDGLLDSP